MLIEAGGEVNLQDENGWTPLHRASAHGEVEIIHMLIEAGGEVNLQTTGQTGQTGQTPLHVASKNGHVEAITALLAAGSDKTIENKYGRTPHDVAKNQDCRNALE